MESANKAIIMAFGMLVAVMIIGTIVYVFNNLKGIPQEDDYKQTVEQVAAFNLQYEVYDKKIMYGVDVISVLNKAQSNNEKYVQGNFLSGSGYNTDYIIDIVVEIKEPLEERMVVTYIEQNAYTVAERDYMEGQGTNKKANEIGFKVPSLDYCKLIYNKSNFWNDLELKSQTIETEVEGGIYHLLSGTDIEPGKYTNAMIEGDSTLKLLLEQSAQMSQTIKNPTENRMIVGIDVGGVMDIDEANTGWNKATWYPAIYDLKTRKFKCLGDEIVYSEKTGRIIQMKFEEI